MNVPNQSAEFASHICGICFKQSHYICPRCGINYCSLACYRSEKHNQCSEAFYRDCCMDSMRNRFSDSNSRSRMLDILRREADASKTIYRDTDDSRVSNDPEDNESTESEVGSDDQDPNLDLNCDTLDTNLVWSKLPMQEKREFCRLINSGEIKNYVPLWVPWWHVKNDAIVEVDHSVDVTNNPSLHRLPPPLRLSEIFPSGKLPHHSVVFVLLDVLLGYAFIARLYNGDYMDLKHEAASNFCQIVASFGCSRISKSPPKEKSRDTSRTVILSPSSSRIPPTFSSISQVVGSVQIRLCQLKFPCSPQTMVVLLEDAVALTRTVNNVGHALEDAHILINSVRSGIDTEGPTEHEAPKKQLLNAHHKLAFLRSCFSLQDPTAVEWQATVFPTFQSQLSVELCKQITSFSTENSRPVEPAAGPNWRQMIRDSKERVITQLM
ncbi:HIT zinc finger, partial [Opisthorchis viverrini]